MSITIFIPRDNGDLKYVAEVDEVERPDMALDALLDEMPRVANQSTIFAAVVGSMEEGGEIVILELDPEAPVEERPKRAIRMSNNGSTQVVESVDDEPAPAPRRRGRPKGSTTRGRTTGTKTAAKKVDGRTKAGRAAKARAGGRSPFKARAEDD